MADGDQDADSLTELVRVALRRDVLTLVLEPGRHLTLRELKARYGTGATPLREALWNLVGEGLIRNEARSGFRVTETNRDRLLGIFEMRRRVEPWALGLAMERGGPAWQEKLRQAYERLAAKDALIGDRRVIDTEWEDAHRAFHLALLQGCGLSSLMTEIARWQGETDRYRRLISRNLGDTVGNKDDHDLLFQAVSAGDGELAVATLTRHIIDTTERHLEYFD